MKKIYSKPQIVFDSFELSQSIAAGCEYKSNHAYGSCALDVDEPGWNTTTLFVSGVGDCSTKTQDGVYNGICYHVPTDDKNVFSS